MVHAGQVEHQQQRGALATSRPVCSVKAGAVSRSSSAQARTTAATSAPLAAEVDEIQYGTDSGPCLDALRRGEVVAADDLATDTRWPDFASFAVAHGLGSSLSLPHECG